MIDVHPATILWWEQRETCRRCAHHLFALPLKRSQDDGVGGERCKACPAERGKRKLLYCIDARLEGKPCGPEAKLFVARPAPIIIHKPKRSPQ
jgi:hypothetical protein